jgi:hypothetical protein
MGIKYDAQNWQTISVWGNYGVSCLLCPNDSCLVDFFAHFTLSFFILFEDIRYPFGGEMTEKIRLRR